MRAPARFVDAVPAERGSLREPAACGLVAFGLVDDRLAEEAELVVERAHDAAPLAFLGWRLVVGIGPRSMMPFLGEETPHGIRRLRSLGEPLARLRFVDDDGSRFGARIVVTENLDEAAVARRARVGHDESIRRLFLRAHAAQSNSYHTFVYLPRLVRLRCLVIWRA